MKKKQSELNNQDELEKKKTKPNKKKQNNPKIIDNPIKDFPGTEIDLTKFNLLSDKKQYDEIKKTLEDIYKDNLKVTRKHVMKVISLTLTTVDDYTYLPYNLKVSKEKLKLKFEVVEKKPIGFGIILLAFWGLIFSIVGASYAGVYYWSIKDLNKDVDGDGIADINIDIDGDKKADINVDTNKDDKPNLNIDYKGNRKAVFNIDYDGDGKADYNLVTDVTIEGTVCEINCDTNGDGWPDINIDIDGDGKPDLDIDTNNDGLPDLNLDIDGDGVCDIMCDTDGDGKPDKNLIESPIGGKQSGTSTTTGTPDTNQETASLILRFIDGETLSVEGLMPDDQPYYNVIRPYKTFSVENLSNVDLTYSIIMQVGVNTFITNNFKYKVEATNGAPSLGYTVAPKYTTYIAKDVKIAKKTTQMYRVTFNLEGTNTPQNDDQGKEFKATFKIEVPQ